MNQKKLAVNILVLTLGGLALTTSYGSYGKDRLETKRPNLTKKCGDNEMDTYSGPLRQDNNASSLRG